MVKQRVDAGGGFPAIWYTLKKAWQAGGWFTFYQRMASKNACKTCALGMGGQAGGMVNEVGHFPEFCKKSIQAQAADMLGTLSEDFLNTTPIAYFEQCSSKELENMGRLTFPIIAEPGDTHYRRISWEDAMDRSAAAMTHTDPNRFFLYASGRSSNEAAFLAQLVIRAYGSPHINNCSYYCHQASGVALNKVYGSGTASVVLDDLEHADFAMVVGANPASNHPRLITQLINMRKRGGTVVVINPLKELGLVRFRLPSQVDSLLFGSDVSDVYVQPKVGTDIALLKGILKGLIEHNHLDTDFIENHTSHWQAVKKDIEHTSWETLSSTCGVSKEDIQTIVTHIAQAKHGIFMWAMGLTHHTHGVDNILALANIALSQGWLGKPHAGLLPIRGHSNVQGVGTVGVTPALKAAFADKLTQLFDITLPKEAGMDTYACMAAAANGTIDTALLLGGNLYASNPDTRWAGQALNTIPTTIGMTTKLNTGHFHGRGQTSILLPVLARDEEPQATTQESMFNFIRLSEGGTPAVSGDMRSEVAIIADLAQRVLPDKGIPWQTLQSHAHLRQVISQIVPGLGQIDTMDHSKQEFQMTGRTFHTPHFATNNGKAYFHVTPLPEQPDTAHPFQLMTLRSEGQFNSVVYEEEDLYRGNRHRQVVMLSQVDADALQIKDHQLVTVTTPAGSLTVEASITDISPGSLAMYYPEANALVPQELDPDSKTPAFKSVPASLAPAH